MNNSLDKFLQLSGFNQQTLSHRERLITSFGGFCGILGVVFISDIVLDAKGAAMIIASMGASAVLLFALPLLRKTCSGYMNLRQGKADPATTRMSLKASC